MCATIFAALVAAWPRYISESSPEAPPFANTPKSAVAPSPEVTVFSIVKFSAGLVVPIPTLSDTIESLLSKEPPDCVLKNKLPSSLPFEASFISPKIKA